MTSLIAFKGIVISQSINSVRGALKLNVQKFGYSSLNVFPRGVIDTTESKIRTFETNNLTKSKSYLKMH